ncbi:MAG: hypothetical protein PWR29_444 [Methanolobus sp.]|jgi:hypothetical protein|nr:hypothetical protein [Methanolobus sp.]MDK2834016.1 hypothetical protein [Methanolobus sp.]MDK2911487.1 hypothetical protein [Methanolobus sp.]MDN5308728.1 hypothetical protein [Methanolobus sp.]
MPFTPFHLGPALFIGVAFEKRVNLFSILLGSIIIDIRAAYCLFAGCWPLHGLLHNFLRAALIAAIITWLLFSQRARLQKVTDRLRIRQTYSFASLFLGSLAGTWSHVLLDSLLYTDIRPLWPLTANPLHGMLGTGTVYLICMLLFLPAAAICSTRYWKRG